MKIIIAGAGEVGFHLAKLLSYESQEITLIDTDRASLSYADNHLDIKVLKGDATSIAMLKEAKVEMQIKAQELEIKKAELALKQQELVLEREQERAVKIGS